MNSLFKMTYKHIKMVIFAIALVALSGCASTSTDAGYFPDYQEASADHAPTINAQEDILVALDPAKREGIERFKDLFANIRRPDLAERITEVYAEQIYFNDTLHTYKTSEALAEYLVATAEKLNDYTVNYEDLMTSGDNIYIRWIMKTQFTVLGNEVTSQSVGISQIRLDENGQVNFHQDFWDSTEGIFRHIPMVGYFIGQARKRI